MNLKQITCILIIICSIMLGLFACSEAPFDPNARREVGMRGDLNLDGIAYTIADAVMFSNYFISGIEALNYKESSGYEHSITASDANDDGRTLDLADLVYLIRTVVGDALTYTPPTEDVSLLRGSSVLAVDTQLGAAYVVIAGYNIPVLLAHVEMKTAFDGVNTRVLVWSMDGNSFTGQFLGNVGTVVSVELATVEGGRVRIIERNRHEPGLGQNYPNPFNPTTSIVISMPTESDYQLVIKHSNNKFYVI